MSLMDMGAVVVELNRLHGEIEVVEGEHKKFGQELAAADSTYRAAHAKAVLSSDQTSDVKRRADADVKCEPLYLAYRVAEERVKGARAAQSRIGEQIGLLRSLNKLYSVEP